MPMYELSTDEELNKYQHYPVPKSKGLSKDTFQRNTSEKLDLALQDPIHMLPPLDFNSVSLQLS